MAITYDAMNGRALLPHSGSLPMHTAETTFRRAHPIFEGTSLLDELRTTESDRTYPSIAQNEVTHLNHSV